MNISELAEKIITFRNARNWKQFHNAKDCAISLSLEASELLEIFQWKDSSESIEHNLDDIKDELADILYYVILMSHDLNIDLNEALLQKLKKNEEKYPVSKSYGSNKKYTQL